MNSIVFVGWEVLATLDSRKRCFTRPLKPQPVLVKGSTYNTYEWPSASHRDGDKFVMSKASWWEKVDATYCMARFMPYQPGQEVFVRETWARVPTSAYRASTGVTMAINPNDRYECAVFKADWERVAPYWLSPAIAPEWASRLRLTITDVKVRRVHEMSGNELAIECVNSLVHPDADYYDKAQSSCFEGIWDATYAKQGLGWESNPFVYTCWFDVK